MNGKIINNLNILFKSQEEGDDESKKKLVSSSISLVRMAVLPVLIFVLLVFAAIAWFASNNTVTSTGMSVGMLSMPYELAVPEDPGNVGAKSYIQTGSGNNATYDSGTEINSMSGAINAADGTLGEYTYITNVSTGTTSTGNFYTTSGGSTIKWRLESAYDKTDDGLGPASYGTFTFYVVPKVTGTIEMKINLGLEGYMAEVDKNDDGSFEVNNLQVIGSNHAKHMAVEYLNTHLMFFKGRTGSGTELDPYYYTDLINGEGLELTFNNCVIDRLIPVTVYWIWPNTFAEMTCIAAKGNIANPSGNTEAVNTVNEVRQFVVDRREQLLRVNAATALSYMADTVVVDGENVSTFNTTKATSRLSELSIAYNSADQYIGTSIQYFLLSLTAE